MGVNISNITVGGLWGLLFQLGLGGKFPRVTLCSEVHLLFVTHFCSYTRPLFLILDTNGELVSFKLLPKKCRY